MVYFLVLIKKKTHGFLNCRFRHQLLPPPPALALEADVEAVGVPSTSVPTSGIQSADGDGASPRLESDSGGGSTSGIDETNQVENMPGSEAGSSTSSEDDGVSVVASPVRSVIDPIVPKVGDGNHWAMSSGKPVIPHVVMPETMCQAVVGPLPIGGARPKTSRRTRRQPIPRSISTIFSAPEECDAAVVPEVPKGVRESKGSGEGISLAGPVQIRDVTLSPMNGPSCNRRNHPCPRGVEPLIERPAAFFFGVHTETVPWSQPDLDRLDGAVTTSRGSGWYGPLEVFEEEATVPALELREIREEDEQDGPASNIGCSEDDWDAASNVSIRCVGNQGVPYDPKSLICSDPTSAEMPDEMMESVATRYEERMSSYLLERPSIEDILTILERFSPHVEALNQLMSSDFLDWEGPPLAVALQVAAVSGPRIWVPLHLEMRERCGYVK